MECLIANGRSDTPRIRVAQAAGGQPPGTALPPRVYTETEAVAGPAVFAEWLAAHGLQPVGAADTLAAVGAFMKLDRSLGWSGNLRRNASEGVAIRRGERTWSFLELAESDPEWREAAGERAEGFYDELVRVVADHLLCADTRPDDTLVWRGDPADPWPFGALAIGASLVLRPRATAPGAR